MNYARGLLWRKWDLHVHTPDSIDHNYSGTREEQWNRFLQELEELPAELKVIGINDYIFLDGYRKVLAERAAGRLGNLDLILPVIELRLDKFGGSDEHFSRVNCHILFSDALTPDQIQHQFLNALPTKYKLTPIARDVAGTWEALPTRESIQDLGQKIIDSTPPEKLKGNPSALHLGFSNINFSINEVRAALHNHYLIDQHLVAVGKTEWADFKWNDQLIAEKKDIINGADLVFTAAESRGACNRARDKLIEEGVNSKLFDCSDAHAFLDSADKDRLGNCLTWIKADTTFEGLRQSLREYEGRVFLGDEPPKLRVVISEGGRFLRSIVIKKKDNSRLAEDWFDSDIELHHDLVVIIGRKGSGKSALTDVIGLLAESPREDSFSFLNKERFRHPRENKAGEFEATLTYENGTETTKRLDEAIDGTSPPRVNYIPQSFFENICSEIARGNDAEFQLEIEGVIFSRLDRTHRLGQRSLRDLIDYRTREIQEAADILREDLEEFNNEIVSVERMLFPEYTEEIKNKLVQRKQDLLDHEEAKPEEVAEPRKDGDEGEESTEHIALHEKKEHLDTIDNKIGIAEECQTETARKLAAVGKVELALNNLEERHRRGGAEIREELTLLGIKWDDIAKLEINRTPLTAVKTGLEEVKTECDNKLAEEGDGSLKVSRAACAKEIKELKEKLDEPQQKYQEYLEALKTWKTKKGVIVGDKETLGSISDLEARLKELKSLPAKLKELEGKRLEVSGQIYAKLMELVDLYTELYSPVQEFVDRNETVRKRLGLAFDVFVRNNNFENGFLQRISRNVKGTFSGPEGPSVLREIVERADFDDRENTLAFLGEISSCLHRDKGSIDGDEFRVESQLRKDCTPEELYQYIFGLEYLLPQYTLAMGGKPLSALSPGERGTLLLIFYLLVDDSNAPVILDQPDENLDNETVYELLVPCIREAKQHRQVLVVTHNPNIAVVCDADQVIHASIDKANNNSVTYESGAIENPAMNKHLLDVLEGTRPAFDNRDDKYFE